MLTFRLNITSWAFFDVSGLKLFFHWYAQLLILSKSSFKSICDKLTSWITDNIEVSSAKSFGLDFRPLDKLDRGEGPESILGEDLHLHLSKVNVGYLKFECKAVMPHSIKCLGDIQKYSVDFKTFIKRLIYLMRDWKKLINIRIPSFHTWLMWWY